MIPIAILFSQVKVQSADQSETFLIGGIPKEYDDLTASVQLEWFLQDIDSDETVQVHADAYLYGEGEVEMQPTQSSATSWTASGLIPTSWRVAAKVQVVTTLVSTGVPANCSDSNSDHEFC